MESTSAQTVRIASVVVSYWVVSISLVFLNKFLLSSPELNLNAPFFITWFQCVVTVLTCAVLGHVSKMAPQHVQFPTFQVQYSTLKQANCIPFPQVLPLSLVFVGMITCNNLCLRNVGVAFYYIGRSLTTVFNVMLTYTILNQMTSYRAMMCCSVIIAGFFLGVDQENLAGSLSMSGVIYGVLASALVALNAIYTKKILPLVGNNMWRLTLYNNVNACLLFLPMILLSDEPIHLVEFKKYGSSFFWIALSLSGIFGMCAGYTAGLQIQVTSPLTHNVSGTAKACTQTVLACLVFQQSKSFLWWLSNVIVLAGSMAYTKVRHDEMKSDRASKMFSLKDRIEEIEAEPLRPVR